MSGTSPGIAERIEKDPATMSFSLYPIGLEAPAIFVKNDE
jgi:hypothetical protein